MTHRYNKQDGKARKARRAMAHARPELGYAPDGFARKAAASPHSAPIKVQDEATQRLIDEALAARSVPTILAAG